MEALSKRLKNLRKEKQLTQAELGEKLGFSRATIAAYEQGVRLPSSKTLCDIADYFGISVDYLLGLTDFRYRLDQYISDNSSGLLLVIDPESGEIINCSTRATIFYNCNKQELLHKNIYDITSYTREDFRKNIKKNNSTIFIP